MSYFGSSRSTLIYRLFSAEMKSIRHFWLKPFTTSTMVAKISPSPFVQTNRQLPGSTPRNEKLIHDLFMSYIGGNGSKTSTHSPVSDTKLNIEVYCAGSPIHICMVAWYALRCSQQQQALFLKTGLAAYYKDVLHVLRNDPGADLKEYCSLYHRIAKLGDVSTTDTDRLTSIIDLKALLEFPTLLLSKGTLSSFHFDKLLHGLQLIMAKASDPEKLAASDAITSLHDEMLKMCGAIFTAERNFDSRTIYILHRLCYVFKVTVPDDLRARFTDAALAAFDRSVGFQSPVNDSYYLLMRFACLAQLLGVEGRRRLPDSPTGAPGHFWIDKWLSCFVDLNSRVPDGWRPSDTQYFYYFVELCVKFDRIPFFLLHKADWVVKMRSRLHRLTSDRLEALQGYMEQIADSIDGAPGTKNKFREEMRCFLVKS